VVHDVRDVEDLARRDLLDRVVDGGLEAVQEQDQVGVRDLGRLLDGQLEVVRLGARLGEVRDPIRWATKASG
jgi:hypothetical protein